MALSNKYGILLGDSPKLSNYCIEAQILWVYDIGIGELLVNFLHLDVMTEHTQHTVLSFFNGHGRSLLL